MIITFFTLLNLAFYQILQVGYFTTAALLGRVTSIVDNGYFADAIYLDFSKAFNSVPYK